ncbi:MAG: sugar porter family MFS transporter [Bacteroidota bacterium]
MNGKRNWILIGASLTAAFGGFLFGFDTAVISGTLSFVQQQFHLTTLEEGWYVSSALVGCIAGVAIAGTLSDRFGRRKVLLLSSFLFLLSTAGCTIAPALPTLIASRLVAGMAIGVASMLAPLYISEIAPAQRRGMLVALYQFAITLGILCAYFSNAWVVDLSNRLSLQSGLWKFVYVDEVWRGMFGNMLGPNIVFILLLLFIPESPRWLIAHGRADQARAIMEKIVAPGSLESEFRQISDAILDEQPSFLQLFQAGMRKPLLVGLLLPMFSQLSGINAIIYYGPKILSEAGFSISDALGGQVSIGIVNVLFTVLAIQLVDRWGRKPLLLIGISGVILSLSAVGFLFALGISHGWLLIGFIMCFIACFAFSLGPVTWIVISEIFPTHIRGRAMALATFAVWGTNAVVGQLFPWLLEHLGSSGTFWTFAIICLPSIPFLAKVLPETKGKTLEEVEASFHSQAPVKAL